MASTPTSRLRLALQATYDNPETWGEWLNSGGLALIDESCGGAAIPVGANVTLSVENYSTDQARRMFLMLSGAGGFTITVPAVDKMYFVINDCAADVTVKPLAGTGAVVRAGTKLWWYCDGTNGFVADPTLDKIKAPAADVAMNGKKLTGVADPTAAQDAATKNYIDTLASSGNLGIVAGIAPQIIAVAAIDDEVVTVAAIDDKVTTVANNALAVALVGTNMVDVQTVADDTAPLNTVAANIASVNTVATNVADVTNFADVYQGAKASAPTTRNDGTPLQAGDLYFDTVGDFMANYTGLGWGPIETLSLSSQAQAEAGTDNTTAMTPLRVAQATADLAWVYLADATASASASISFTNSAGTWNAYRGLVIMLDGICPSTSATLQMLMSTNNGGSYLSGSGAYWSGHMLGLGAIESASANFTSQMAIPDTNFTSAVGGLGATLYTSQPYNNSARPFRVQGIVSATRGALSADTLVGTVAANTNGNVSTTWSGIRFQMSTGTITSGRFTLFGIR